MSRSTNGGSPATDRNEDGTGDQNGASAANASNDLLKELLNSFGKGTNAAPKVNCFAGVAMNKIDGFPPLVSVNPSTSIASRISADEGMPWVSSATSWFGAHGSTGIIELCKSLISLDNDRKQLKPFFPENPELEALTSSIDCMRLILIKVSKSSFGNHVLMLDEDEIGRLEKGDVRRMFANFSTVCSQLSFRLRTAATPPGTTTTLMHDVFGPSNEAAFVAGGEQHPLSGLIILHQILDRFQRDPQGTTIQMKARLLAEIQENVTNHEFNLYATEAFLQAIDIKINSILNKEPAMRLSLEMEVNTLVCQVVRAASRRTSNNIKNPEGVLDAAESISFELTKFASQATTTTWSRFQSMILSLLTQLLPPPATQTKAKQNEHAMAAYSGSGHWKRRKTKHHLCHQRISSHS